MNIFLSQTLSFIIFLHVGLAQENCDINLKGTKSFINRLFQRYGNSTEYISNAQFLNLMKNLYLGTVFFECQAGDLECKKNAILAHGFGKSLPKGESINIEKKELVSENRTKRQTLDADEEAEHQKEIEEHKKHWQMHLDRCIKPDVLLEAHNVTNVDRITRLDFFQLCPSIVEQIDAKVCVHTHIKEIESLHRSHSKPTSAEVWGYGMLSITVISLLSLSVISMIPCLKKSYYHKIMGYLVALAVGTLAGDALLHLIPHAFAEGANAATNLKVSEEDQLKQHYSQVWRALFVLLGIYLFFLVEQLMKIKSIYCGGGGHGHSHGSETKARGHSHGSGKGSPIVGRKDTLTVQKSPSNSSMVAFIKDSDEKSPSSTSDESTDHVAIELQSLSKTNENGVVVANDDEEENYHGDDRHHHHHHGEKEITKETKIASVAWMVVVGDGFHNFSDGLAVGAAFSASLSSGLSTAIAVFCHELPHELGDFAILINAGMTFKQAIVYNMVSAILAYCGLAVGILIGESETGRHFILSLTAGLFLYVSLTDMLPELTHQEVPQQSRCSSFMCQHLGILSGIGIMLVISLYEHIM